MGKITCVSCSRNCKEQALKVGDKHFHVDCFICKECHRQLVADGFYMLDGSLYCPEDYQSLFGVKCCYCNQYVVGEAVNVLEYTYHDTCFCCTNCRTKLSPGDKVKFLNANTFLCSSCSSLISDERHRSGCDKKLLGNCSGCEIQGDYGKFYNCSYLDKVDALKRGPSMNTCCDEKSPRHYHRPENFSYTSVKKDFVEQPKQATLLSGDSNDVDEEEHDEESQNSSVAECDPTTGLKNTRLRPMYLSEGSQGRTGRPVPASEPRKIFPYEQLLVSNFTLPAGVERTTVEQHLSDEDFSKLFHMDRDEFYRLAEWKRNDMKRKVGLY